MIPRTSPPALPLSSQGSIGTVHGLQSAETWQPGASDSRQICDQLLAAKLWRLTVLASSNIALNLVYGTQRTLALNALSAPLVAYIPGQCAVYATPIAVDGQFPAAYARISLTPVNGGGHPQCRLFMKAGILPDAATSFFATQASSIQLLGGSAPTAVPSGTRIPLLAGAVLISGEGFAEFEP